MTKLKIDLNTGMIEVEGEEQFVRDIYNDYKLSPIQEKLSRKATPDPLKLNNSPIDNLAPSREANKPVKVKRSGAKEEYNANILEFTVEDVKELRDFFDEKKPASGWEKNVVFVYFMQKKKNLSGIKLDHIYACYTAIPTKFGSAFRQSIIDTSSKKKWLNTSNMDDIKLSLAGETLVVHDLPNKNDKNGK